MLISAVMPIMSVYRLPQGQYGYSGHVVNLPQDVTSFVQSLPRLPSNLDVIIVRKEGANQSHRDFRVRHGVVHRALHSTDANRRDFTILSLCTSHHIKFIIIALSSYLLCTECAERQLVLKCKNLRHMRQLGRSRSPKMLSIPLVCECLAFLASGSDPTIQLYA